MSDQLSCFGPCVTCGCARVSHAMRYVREPYTRRRSLDSIGGCLRNGCLCAAYLSSFAASLKEPR